MNIFESAIMCIDASLKSAPEMAESGDESLYVTMNDLIQAFRDKYEITEKDLGNSDVWENSTYGSELSKDTDQLNVDIMMVIWEHIKELMLECGAGDVAREVFASEILNVPLSWDVKEETEKKHAK